MSLWPFQRCEKSATLSPENRRGCLLFNLYNSLSILSDIHSAAKSVWQGLGQRAHFQWPLTLVCPDTYDECLQDTEGRQPAMSGFYYVLQRLGTVSLIKQIILEGKATGKRRRKTGGKCVFATHSDKKEKSKISTHPTHSVCVVCVCVITQPPLSRLENILPFLPFHLSPQGPCLLWGDSRANSGDGIGGCWESAPWKCVCLVKYLPTIIFSSRHHGKERQDHLGRGSYIGMAFIKAKFPLASPEEHSAQQLPQ